MKTISTTLLILFFVLNSKSQIFQKHKIEEISNFGFYSSGSYSRFTEGNVWELWMLIEPYFGITKWNVNFSLIGEYTFQRGNYENVEIFDLYGFGGFLRYHYPFRINTCKKNTRYFIFQSEFSARATNHYYYNVWNFKKANNLKYYHLVFVPIGMQFNIWKGLYVDLSTEWNFYSKGANYFIYRTGFEYKFNYKKKNEKKDNINTSL